jgi:CubicO group peptidase (beta-lactamase class C family)
MPRLLIVAILLILGLGAAFRFDPLYGWRFLRYNLPGWDDTLRVFPTITLLAAETSPNLTFQISPVDRVGEKLDMLLPTTETRDFLVLREGIVTYRWRADGQRFAERQPAWSLSKCVTVLAVGHAIERGLIEGWDTTLGDYVEGLAPDVAALSLNDLANMTAPVAYRTENAPWAREPRLYYGTDRRPLLLTATIDPASEGRFHYNNINADLLGLVLTAVAGPPQPFLTDVWQSLGAGEDAEWVVDSAANGVPYYSGGLSATTEDLARLGLLVLRAGMVDGHRLAGVATFSTPELGEAAAAGKPPAGWDLPATGFDRCWWSPDVANAQDGDRLGLGAFGQIVYIAPRTDTVVVRTGRTWDDLGLAEWVRLAAEIAHADGTGNADDDRRR